MINSGAHVIGLQELNVAHSDFVVKCLPDTWQLCGFPDANNGTHIAWDTKTLQLVGSFNAVPILPDATDAYRKWRAQSQAIQQQ